MLNTQEALQLSAEYATIKNSLNNNNKKLTEEKDADVLFIIQHNLEDNSTVLDNIADFKNNKFEYIHENIENKFNMLLDQFKDANLFYDKLKEKIERAEGLVDKLTKPLYQVKNIKQNIGIASKIKDVVLNGNNENLLVTKYFLNKINEVNENVRYTKINSIFDNQTQLQSINSDIDNIVFDVNYFREHCGVLLPDNVIDIQNESSFTTQIMLNTARSINTLSFNMSGESLNIATSFKYDSRSNEFAQSMHYITDPGNISVWKYIDDKKFNVSDFLYDIFPGNIFETSSNTRQKLVENSLWPGFDSTGNVNVLLNRYEEIPGFYFNNVIENIYNTTSSITKLTYYSKFSNLIDRVNRPKHSGDLLKVITSDYYNDFTDHDPIAKISSIDSNTNEYFINYFSENTLKSFHNANRKNKKLITLRYDTNNQRQDNLGSICVENEVFSPNLSINVVHMKNNVDTLIKDIKKRHIENLNIDITIFKEMQKNIRDSKNKFVMLSYSPLGEESSDVSILKENDLGFKFLWQKKENNIFSSKLFNNKTVKIASANFEGFNIIEEDEEDLDVLQSLYDLMSNYYIQGPFYSSSKFFIEVLKDFESLFDSDYINSNNTSDIFTEFCYLNTFLSDKKINENAKEVIIKRFLMESIKKRDNTSSKIKRSKFKEFKYDINIQKEITGGAEEGEIKSLLKRYLNSSPSLKTISSNVWSADNVSDIVERYRLSCKKVSPHKFSAIATETVNEDETISKKYSSDFSLKRSKYNTRIEKIDEIQDKNKTIYGLHYDLIYTTQRFPFMYNMGYFSTLYNKVEDHCFIDTDFEENTTNFILKDSNIFKSDDIVTRVNVKNKNRRSENNIYTQSSFYVKDKFESLMNTPDSIFGKISKKINQLIDITTKDIDNIRFETEDDIIQFLNNHKYIFDFVDRIINIYALFHELISQKKSDLLFQKLYVYISENMEDFPKESVFKYSNEVTPLVNLVKFSTLSYNKIYTQCDDNIFDFRVEKDLFNDLFVNIDNFKENPLQFFNQNNITNNNDFGVNKVLRDLVTSDLSQAFNFDLMRMLIEEKNNINENLRNIESAVEDIADLLELEPNEISRSIEKDHYMSNVFKNVFNKTEKSLYLYEKFIKNNDRENLLSFMKSNSVFEKRKNSRIIQKNNLSKEKSIYTYAFKINNLDLNGINNELFKVTIIPRSKVYPERLYFPIFKYFSKRVKKVKTKNNDFADLFYYDKNIVDFFIKVDNIYDEILASSTLYEYVYDKVDENENFESQETSSITTSLVQSVFDNHRESQQIEETLRCRYGIENDVTNAGSSYFESITNILPEKIFYDVFSVSKEDFINNSRQLGFNTEREMLKSINYIFEDEFESEEEIYYFNLNNNDFYYLNVQDEEISPFSFRTNINLHTQINVGTLPGTNPDELSQKNINLLKFNNITRTQNVKKSSSAYEIKNLDFTIKIEVI